MISSRIKNIIYKIYIIFKNKILIEYCFLNVTHIIACFDSIAPTED